MRALALAVAGILAGLASAGCGDGDGSRAPNLLIVSVDTLRADHLGAWGDTQVDTPALDALAERALVFDRAYTSIPITTPSLAALMTSRVPRSHGALNNTYDLLLEESTLAETLTARGYRSGAFLPSALADKSGFKRGFEAYDYPASFDVLRDASDVVHRAVTWIQSVEDEGDDPWFCWVHVLEPHSPYAPPADLEAKYLPPGTTSVDPRLRKECIGVERVVYDDSEVAIVRALYRAEVEATDRALAPLIDWVELHARGGERAAHGDVVFAFTADHGEMLYEHDQYVGHTAWLYEPMLRVPLLLRFTDDRYRGERSGFPANLIDVYPTLAALAGAELGPRDGVDLLLQDGGSRRVMVHETFAPEGHYDQQALRQEELKYLRRIDGLPAESLRGGEPRLFDTEGDPGESADLAAEQAERVSELEAAFRRWASAKGDPHAMGRPEVTQETIDFLRKLGYSQGAIDEYRDEAGSQ